MSGLPQSNSEIVKAHDSDRYSATLFAPDAKREDLFTLYAFDAELSRIRAVISDPLPGEIRLQWWREVVTGGRAGEDKGNALAEGISTIIERYSVPLAALEAYFDARTFEFYNDAFPDTNSMEAWYGETSSAILQIASLILDSDAAKQATDASGHGGIAVGIANSIQRMATTRARGQCFLPADLMKACGIDRETFVTGANKAGIKSATDALCALGQSHLTKFKLAAQNLPKSVKPAFLPVYNAGLTLEMAAKMSANPAFEPIAPSALRSLFGTLRTALWST